MFAEYCQIAAITKLVFEPFPASLKQKKQDAKCEMRILIRLFWGGLNAIEIYFSRANHYLAISCISGAEWKINPASVFSPGKKEDTEKSKANPPIIFSPYPIPVSMAKINQDVQTAKSPQHSSWLIHSLVQIPSQISFHPVSPVPSLLSSVPPFFPSPCMFFRFV